MKINAWNNLLFFNVCFTHAVILRHRKEEEEEEEKPLSTSIGHGD